MKTTIGFCSIVSTVESCAFTAFTGGTFAPFGSCYPTKDGGGYYLLGQDAPGNGRLFLTSTIYEPLEWSLCGVRSYGFTISKRGSVMNIDQAINAVKASEKFLKMFGINDHDALSNGLRELYNEVGDFAISLGFDSNTDNISIYVSHSGSSVKNNSLVK